MWEFLFELLGLLIEFFLEVFLEYASGAIVDAVLRLADRVLGIFDIRSRTGASFIFGLLGAATGWLSLAVFPHPLVPPSRFHGISLLVSPVVTGLLLWWTGSALRKRDKKATQIQNLRLWFCFRSRNSARTIPVRQIALVTNYKPDLLAWRLKTFDQPVETGSSNWFVRHLWQNI